MTSRLSAWPRGPLPTSFGRDEPFDRPLHAISENEQSDVLVSGEQLARTLERLTQRAVKKDDRDWAVALRILAARLRGLRFSEAARVAGLKPSHMARILHGDLLLQPSKAIQVDRMLVLTQRLALTLQEDAIGEWFMTEIPALGDLTPLQAIERHRIDDVEKVVESYLDFSYS